MTKNGGRAREDNRGTPSNCRAQNRPYRRSRHAQEYWKSTPHAPSPGMYASPPVQSRGPDYHKQGQSVLFFFVLLFPPNHQPACSKARMDEPFPPSRRICPGPHIYHGDTGSWALSNPHKAAK